MNRLAVALVGVVLIVGVVGAVGAITAGESGSDATEPAVELPTFESTPEPKRYDSLEQMSAELARRGLPCGELVRLDLEKAGHEGLEDFATCYLMSSQGMNINLWLFDSTKTRDSWLLGGGTSYIVFGPNWMVTPNDPDRARAVHGALGGTLKEPSA